MTCAYMPDGSTYNGKSHRICIPEEYENRLKVGDVLDDNELLPLIWKRA
jgi:hypothetical protein